MVEVQFHGFSFEKWVRDSFFEGYAGSYMQKWDVPPEINRAPTIPPQFRYLPVSIKTAKYGSPIGLGDVLRQRQIESDFVIIAGFWHQRSKAEKWFSDIGVIHCRASVWSDLWGELTLRQLQNIDRVVKDMTLSYTTARLRAREWKRDTPGVHSARFVINPKIDSKTQRRIQCSLPFSEFWHLAGRTPQTQEATELWGVPFPNPVNSSSRVFRR